MTTATRTGHRGVTAAVLLVGGGAVAAATWASGDHGLAVGLVAFYVLAAGVAYLWSGGKGDVAAIMRVGGDERQKSIDRDATAITGMRCRWRLSGAIVETARDGDPGAFGVMCLVGGCQLRGRLIALRHRR